MTMRDKARRFKPRSKSRKMLLRDRAEARARTVLSNGGPPGWEKSWSDLTEDERVMRGRLIWQDGYEACRRDALAKRRANGPTLGELSE